MIVGRFKSDLKTYKHIRMSVISSLSPAAEPFGSEVEVEIRTSIAGFTINASFEALRKHTLQSISFFSFHTELSLLHEKMTISQCSLFIGIFYQNR